MTDDTLRPLLPSFTTWPGTLPSGSALPLSAVDQPEPSTAVHSIRPVDTNGRVVDKAIVDALDWHSGDLLSWRVTGGLVLITRPGHGKRGVTKYGHISIPASVRHAAGIRIRERVLLAADPDHALLVVYPATVLDDILARRFAEGTTR
ncbi:AbrB/MazE/SpoVT family DNA-binding domain-containing protein [Nocardia brevicatena]|uniref:AbrB/MazE/SpoVT family DNA-binding domain-containing protein n=1 Tax=Nocardia brevicatena TaxID=37327 RepID=UPI0012F86215|nr:AbrB/MazE/SpoVT family DNA-binding domain-containing protein [Nocardia brevicatena]